MVLFFQNLDPNSGCVVSVLKRFRQYYPKD
jgi:hypothetical protein